MAGPFALYGTAVVDACVRFGAHYVDITGETPWMRDLIDRYDERAAAAGTRIVPACGFDSVPSDIGAYVVAREIRERFGTACADVRAYFRLTSGINGGTLASVMAMAETPGALERVRDPFLLNPPGARDAAEIERNLDPHAARYDDAIGSWTGPFLMSPVNTRVVRRSAALFAGWGEPYGPKFTYQEYLKYGGSRAAFTARAVTTASALFERAVAVPALRGALKTVLPKPGSGPSEETMRRGKFRCELIGRSDDGRVVRGEVSGKGDPGNAITVACVCESALALALDAPTLPGGPARGGILTPATAFGDVLVARLRAAGLTIEAAA